MFAPALRPSAPTLPSQITTPSRPTPVKRRSTLKRSIDETEYREPPSSPSKRSRVTFDSEVELVSADDEEDMDPLVIREEIRRAIQRHQVGDDEAYERVKHIFSAPPEKENSSSNLVVLTHLQAVLANVSSLNKNCSALVHAILSSEWVGRDDAYYALFSKFLGNLAAAQSGFLTKILQMLVDLLGQQKTRRVRDCKPVRQPRIHQRVLQTLRYITQLIPVASSTLAEAVKRRITYDFAKAEERIMFVKNFMLLIDYVPELTSDILTNVMSELVKLDVAIQTELDDEDDDAEDEILHHISSSQTLVAIASQKIPTTSERTIEEEDVSTTDESDMEDEDLSPMEIQRRKLKADVQQVDLIMDMLFQYYSKLISSTKASEETIDQLLTQFQNIILPTYRSRHTQFLIFHFAQTSPIFVDQFVASCISTIVDKRERQYIRVAAAAYFSGFVGRGASVPPSVIQDCIELLCSQLTKLRKEYEPLCRGPNLQRYSDFYAIMQAILYIFCFRWRDLGSTTSDFDDDSEVEEGEIDHLHFPDSLRDALHSAIFSPLNPLRICTPIIVEQFAKLSYALQFLYVHNKIDTNRNIRLHGYSRAVSDLNISQPDRNHGVGENGVMEGYFPYDPYQLPISRHWIEAEYVEWKGIPGEAKIESDSEEEDDMVIVGDIDDEDTAEDEL